MALQNKFEDGLDVLSELKSDWDDMAKDDQADIVAALTSVPVTIWLLTKARRAAKRGDYLRAIYYVLLWIGTTNNNGTASLHRRLKAVALRAGGVRL